MIGCQNDVQNRNVVAVVSACSSKIMKNLYFQTCNSLADLGGSGGEWTADQNFLNLMSPPPPSPTPQGFGGAPIYEESWIRPWKH